MGFKAVWQGDRVVLPAAECVPTALRRTLLGLLVCLGLLGCGGGGGSTTLPAGPAAPLPPVAATGVRLDTGAAGAALSVGPQVVVAGATAHAVWYDRRDGQLDIYYRRSTDWGTTWGFADQRLDTDPAGAGTSLLPRLAVDGANVVVAWQDERAGPGDIRFTRSLDGGVTWLSSDRRVDTDGVGNGDSRTPDLDLQGARVSLVWRDNRDGAYGVYFNQSTDVGDSWRANDVRIDGGTPGVTLARAPQIARAGTALVVAWLDNRFGGTDLMAARSTDEGLSFAAPVRMSTPGVGASQVSRFTLRALGSRVVLAFQDRRSGDEAIYLRTSEDAATTWSSADVRVSGLGARAESPSLGWVRGRAFLAFEDRSAARSRVRTAHEISSGVWSVPVRADDAPAALASAVRPQVVDIALGDPGARTALVWLDDRGGRLAPRVRHASPLDLWADPSEGFAALAGPVSSVHAAWVAAAPRRGVLGVWSDQRDGQDDIYVGFTSEP